MQILVGKSENIECSLTKQIKKASSKIEADQYILDGSDQLLFIDKSAFDVNMVDEKDHVIFIPGAVLLANPNVWKENCNLYFGLESGYGSKKLLETIKEKASASKGVFRMRNTVPMNEYEYQAAEDLYILQQTFGRVVKIYGKSAKNNEKTMYHAIYSVTFANEVMAHLEYTGVEGDEVSFEMEWSSRDIVIDFSQPEAEFSIDLILESAKKAESNIVDELVSLLDRVKGGCSQ